MELHLLESLSCFKLQMTAITRFNSLCKVWLMNTWLASAQLEPPKLWILNQFTSFSSLSLKTPRMTRIWYCSAFNASSSCRTKCTESAPNVAIRCGSWVGSSVISVKFDPLFSMPTITWEKPGKWKKSFHFQWKKNRFIFNGWNNQSPKFQIKTNLDAGATKVLGLWFFGNNLPPIGRAPDDVHSLMSADGSQSIGIWSLMTWTAPRFQSLRATFSYLSIRGWSVWLPSRQILESKQPLSSSGFPLCLA